MPLPDTGSGLGPGPGLIVFGANGLILDYNTVSGVQPNGGTMAPATAYTALPGASILLRGAGEFALMPGQFGGIRGTLEVILKVGAAGTARTVALLADNSGNALGIALDASNAPYAILTDVLGNRKLSTVGPVIPANQQTILQLAWDSQNPLSTGLYANFREQGTIEMDWVGNPNVPWTAFVPTKIYLGVGLTAYTLSTFNGTLVSVQVSPFPVVPTGIALSHEDAASTNLIGTSTVSATLKLKCALTATETGAASVAAALNVP